MALKMGCPCTLGPHTARKWGVRTPGQDPHRIAATGLNWVVDDAHGAPLTSRLDKDFGPLPPI